MTRFVQRAPASEITVAQFVQRTEKSLSLLREVITHVTE
jgi:hypothetical protein